MLKSQLCSFLIHTYVKRLQQQHFESLRDNVDGKEILIQLDFQKTSPLLSKMLFNQVIGQINKVHCSLYILGFRKIKVKV